MVDTRDLYREQLRVAENLLAFLASLSLALLKREDRAGLDLAAYWRGGISPGDWKDIVARCSKVFAGYEDVPLAQQINKLNIRSEKKGFGRDAIGLIRAKNDFKHDRGPSDLESMAEASEGVQMMLRRCMEALSFLADYPLRATEGPDAAGDGGPRMGGLFVDPGDGSHVPLYPFMVPITCPECETDETYFIDAWDRKRDVARMKSFEKGHTVGDPGISGSLSGWEPDGG